MVSVTIPSLSNKELLLRGLPPKEGLPPSKAREQRSSKEELRLAAQVAMEHDLAVLLIEDAEVHGASVKVDPAVVSMLASVETHGPLLGPMSG
jgi:hypothetical protein